MSISKAKIDFLCLYAQMSSFMVSTIAFLDTPRNISLGIGVLGVAIIIEPRLGTPKWMKIISMFLATIVMFGSK